MADPTREEVERVAAGLTEAQREAILGFTAEFPWRLMTEAEARAEFPPGMLMNARADLGGEKIEPVAEKRRRIVDMIGEGIVFGMEATPTQEYPS